jgi:hypothetical protein
LEVQAKVFLEMIGAQLGAQLATELEREERARVNFLNENDAQNRAFTFHSLRVSSAAGIEFVNCPE